MKYAIRDVVREDGVIGTLVLEQLLPQQGIQDRTVLYVSFEPRVAEYTHQRERIILRDPANGFAAVSTIPADDAGLVCGVTDADKKRIFP